MSLPIPFQNRKGIFYVPLHSHTRNDTAFRSGFSGKPLHQDVGTGEGPARWARKRLGPAHPSTLLFRKIERAAEKALRGPFSAPFSKNQQKQHALQKREYHRFHTHVLSFSLPQKATPGETGRKRMKGFVRQAKSAVSACVHVSAATPLTPENLEPCGRGTSCFRRRKNFIRAPARICCLPGYEQSQSPRNDDPHG